LAKASFGHSDIGPQVTEPLRH